MSLFKNYDKVTASSLLESVLAMVIIVVCMSMAITLITKLALNKIRINNLEMIQNVNSVRQEIELGSKKSIYQFKREKIKVIRTPSSSEGSYIEVYLNVYNNEDEVIYSENLIIEETYK